MTDYDPTYDLEHNEKRGLRGGRLSEETMNEAKQWGTEAARKAKSQEVQDLREFNREYVRRMEAETIAFKAHVLEVGVQNLPRDEYIRWMRLTTGDPNFGRRGY